MAKHESTGTLGCPTAAPKPASTCAQRDAFGILAHCHEHILGKLAELEETSRALRREGAYSDALLARFCDALVFLDTAIPMHSADEEQSLFPRLRRCQPFTGRAGDTPMDCMESEHKQHQRLLAALKRALMQREVLGAADAAVAVVNEYRAHIGKENEVLFPWAKELLNDPAEVAVMTREMQARREAVSLKSC
jgi:iron-sulfur cluster repair protein YtfE (RIC family)